MRGTGEAPCPPENPLGVTPPAVAESRRVEPPPADPEEVARLEREVERLRALAPAGPPRAAAWRPPSTLSVTAFLAFARDEEEFFWRY